MRSLITSITPLSSGTSRATAVAFLHDHVRMIRLNPLVIRLQKTTPPPDASADEYDCAWYEITDEISYLPGGLYKGEVTYKACFNDLPNGIQTHTFAPAGLDLRGKWTVGGNEPGEPREKLELGTDAPREGLYVREDVDMRCNFLLTGFVKKNLKQSHKVVMDKLASLGQEGQHGEQQHTEQRLDGAGDDGSTAPKPWSESGRDRTYTPIDGNTMFGPDSYQRGPARPDPSQPQPDDDPDLTDPALYVGHHSSSSPRTEEPRSHYSNSQMNSQAARSTAKSAARLSYLEQERVLRYGEVPQLPRLGFQQESAQRDHDGQLFPDGSAMSAEHLDSPATVNSHHGFQTYRSILHDPGVQAELAAQNSPVERPTDGSMYDAAIPRSSNSAKDSLEPERRAHQRLSTDYTWRPGLKPGAFI
jgi:hypothetical protein